VIGDAKSPTLHSIVDKAEVAIDFPDKFYSGAFGRDCAFAARADAEGFMIRLVRSGDIPRVVEMHLHHSLFADILKELAGSLNAREPIDTLHREALLKAAQDLANALRRGAEIAPE